jgi:hypothetical protein
MPNGQPPMTTTSSTTVSLPNVEGKLAQAAALYGFNIIAGGGACELIGTTLCGTDGYSCTCNERFAAAWGALIGLDELDPSQIPDGVDTEAWEVSVAVYQDWVEEARETIEEENVDLSKILDSLPNTSPPFAPNPYPNTGGGGIVTTPHTGQDNYRSWGSSGGSVWNTRIDAMKKKTVGSTTISSRNIATIQNLTS